MKIIDDATGNEIEVFTAEELAAKAAEAASAAAQAREAELKAEFEKTLADKDAHQSEKFNQFEQAKKAAEKETAEAKALAEAAKKAAEEAQSAIAKANEEKLGTLKDYWIKSVVGNDAELIKRVEENYSLINLPATNDKEIAERVQKAVQLAGISVIQTPGMSFAGGGAPRPEAITQEQKDRDHDEWKKSFGLDAFIPKQQ